MIFCLMILGDACEVHALSSQPLKKSNPQQSAKSPLFLLLPFALVALVVIGVIVYVKSISNPASNDFKILNFIYKKSRQSDQARILNADDNDA